MSEEKTVKNKQPAAKHPTARDWDRIRALYLRGESLDDIIDALPHINISKKSIQNKMSAEGFAAKKAAIDERVADMLMTEVEKEKVAVNELCIKLFNDGSEVIEGLLRQYKDEVSKEKGDRSRAKATAYNTDLLMSGVTKIQKGLRVAYGMDKDGTLYEKEPEVLVIDGLNSGKI